MITDRVIEFSFEIIDRLAYIVNLIPDYIVTIFIKATIVSGYIAMMFIAYLMYDNYEQGRKEKKGYGI